MHFFSDAGFDVGLDGDALVFSRPSTTPWEELRARLDAGGTVALAADVAAFAFDEPLWIHDEVVLDLADVPYMSSAGLRLLLTSHKTMLGKGGELKVANVQPAVKEVLDLTGFSDLLNLV